MSLFWLVLALCGCNSPGPVTITPLPSGNAKVGLLLIPETDPLSTNAPTVYRAPVPYADLKPLVKGNTAFALELYAKVRSGEGNLAFSPYSISAAVGMTYAGARGETAIQIQQALHFPQNETNLPALFAQFDRTLQTAQSVGGAQLNIANSLWPQKQYRFRPEFLELLKVNYRATITPLDYGREPEKAIRTINQWVDENTRHKIPEIVGPGDLNASTRMVLVNAIYFKGLWNTPFQESATRQDKFHVNAQRMLTVPFMNREGSFKYGENAQAKVLVIPYREHQFEMVLVLPQKQDGIAQLESTLNVTNLTAWTSVTEGQDVIVTVPKFKMSTGLGLTQTLQALGMRDAFDPGRADFSGMDGNPHYLYLSDAVHKAFIEVNEKGTEAAAATGMMVPMMGMAMEPPPKPREFRADHPFLFLIRESSTGCILFMGRVMEPGGN
ncbi:serpin family protein [Pedosphaera parvula]|nr:serpin family protein [Pedosphaera parvula]